VSDKIPEGFGIEGARPGTTSEGADSDLVKKASGIGTVSEASSRLRRWAGKHRMSYRTGPASIGAVAQKGVHQTGEAGDRP